MSALKVREGIIKIKTKCWETSHKFGILVPKTSEEANCLGDVNRNTLWIDTIHQEMKSMIKEYTSKEMVPKSRKKFKCPGGCDRLVDWGSLAYCKNFTDMGIQDRRELEMIIQGRKHVDQMRISSIMKTGTLIEVTTNQTSQKMETEDQTMGIP